MHTSSTCALDESSRVYAKRISDRSSRRADLALTFAAMSRSTLVDRELTCAPKTHIEQPRRNHRIRTARAGCVGGSFASSRLLEARPPWAAW